MTDPIGPMVCTGCGSRFNLSRSHIIPKSESTELRDEPENLTWHCLSVGEKIGCHTKHEGMDVVYLDDFEKNMRTVRRLHPEYFWMRILKLTDYYNHNRQVRDKLIQLAKEDEPETA